MKYLKSKWIVIPAIVTLLSIGGVALAAWINGARMNGSANSAAAAYTLNTINATPSMGSSGTCTATKVDDQTFTVTLNNLDATNHCLINGAGSLSTGKMISGVKLVVNGTDVTASSTSPVRAVFEDGPGSACALGGNWTLRISLDPDDSSPGQAYSLNGSQINAAASSATPCVNAGS